jgi:uncharacterized protein YegL
MPKLFDDNTNQLQTTNAYTFSAASPDSLEASDYTLVTLVVDASGSTTSFQKEMIEMVKEIYESCKLSPRASNLMMRVVIFDHNIYEFHGFKMLNTLDPMDYNTLFNLGGGSTALFDSFHTAIDATVTYGKSLTDQGILNNAIVVGITDGYNCAGKFTPKEVKDIILESRKKECLESLRTILIGVVPQGSTTNNELTKFFKEAELDQYECIGDADRKSIAKAAKFISRSVSSQSQSLGTGGPSAAININSF